MPRSALEVPVQLEKLSILEEDGSVDEELMPDLDADLQRQVHRTMLLSRRFDERLLTLQKQGRIGTFAPAIGQAAAQIGAASVLQEQDWMVPSYRDSAASIWRGTPLWGLILYDAGWNEGAMPPEGQRDLPIAVPVASQIPHAAGLAYAAKLRESDEIAMVFFGDGATSEGDFHEAINFAAVQQLPVIFACQNNQYAISTPLELQTASQTLAHKAVAYGVPGLRVDGNDFFAVHVAFAEAAQRARQGEGPTLIETLTYRLSVHTTADDPSVYRDDQEVRQWQEKEPIYRLQRFLIERAVISEDDVEKLEEQIKKQIEDAWQKAEQKMKSMDELELMFECLWNESPSYLNEQAEQFLSQRDAGQSDASSDASAASSDQKDETNDSKKGDENG